MELLINFLMTCLYLFYIMSPASSVKFKGRKGGVDDRIIGGTEADPHEYPHQIGLIKYGKIVCGGSIYNSTLIITAAHCFGKGGRYRVITGAVYREMSRNEAGTTQEIDVEKFTVHPCYKDEGDDHDIALIYPKDPIIFNKFAQHIRLPKENDIVKEGDTVKTIGWGQIKPDDKTAIPDKLMKVNVQITNHEECLKLYKKAKEPSEITKNMICAKTPGQDSCQGDSGGPLISQKFVDKFENCIDSFLAGIVSFGEDCANPIYPGVYTNVYNYICWILTGDWSTKCDEPAVCPPDLRAQIPDKECKKIGTHKDFRKTSERSFSRKISSPLSIYLITIFIIIFCIF